MTPPPHLLAACSAVLFAGSHIASKRGVTTTSVVSGLVISLTVGLITLSLAVMLDPPGSAPTRGILLFAAAGLLGPGIGRAGAVAGVARLGPSTSVPLQTSVYPLFAVVAAVVVLRETLGPARVAGVTAIVLGVWLLSRRSAEPASPDVEAVPDDRASGRSPFTAALIFPLVAGIGYGAADVVRKQGLEGIGEPALGALVGVATALFAWLAALLTSSPLRRRLRWGPTAGWFALGGLLASLALLAQFYALETGDVSTVSPIVATQPLAVLILSSLLLSGIEKITKTVVAGGMAIMLGTMLVAA